MGNKGQAIRPEFVDIKSYIQEQPHIDEETLTEEEKILGQGAHQKFWLTLRQHLENELGILDQIADNAIANGMSLEEIGRNTIVLSQVKGLVHKLFNIVEDSREAVENGKK